MMRQFDTNNDGQISDAENQAAQANTSAVQQLQALEQTINQTNAPIQLARNLRDRADRDAVRCRAAAGDHGQQHPGDPDPGRRSSTPTTRST
jgi:hypothetical protein